MSSYLSKDLSYLDFIAGLTHVSQPKYIVEFGILNGHSLQIFADSGARVNAYDIFEEFNGNHADLPTMQDKFRDYSNVTIGHGDLFQMCDQFGDDSVDLLHIDIANNGDVYQYCLDNYVHKLSKHGVMILEGGSAQRDQVYWMKKYNKPAILPTICRAQERESPYHIQTYGEMPSITVVRRKL